MPTISVGEAAQMMGLPDFLIRDFVSYEFNGRKLVSQTSKNEGLAFDQDEVISFLKHLDSRWPGEDRVDPPDFIQRYLIFEARGKCALCQESKPNYDWAHILNWSASRSNNPHNLLRLCVDCHRSYGNNTKLLKGVKEGLLKHNHLVPLELLYDCDETTVPGTAVFCKDGRAFPAIATVERDQLATGFVGAKIGPDRCAVQRVGVISSLTNLESGEDYYLSTRLPGSIVNRSDFDKEIDRTKEQLLQGVGFAESSVHLVIRFTGDLTLIPGATISG